MGGRHSLPKAIVTLHIRVIKHLGEAGLRRVWPSTTPPHGSHDSIQQPKGGAVGTPAHGRHGRNARIQKNEMSIKLAGGVCGPETLQRIFCLPPAQELHRRAKPG